MSRMNLNPSYFDADEEELIMKYLCQHSRQFYPPHVIAGFPDFNSCHIQDHTVVMTKFATIDEVLKDDVKYPIPVFLNFSSCDHPKPVMKSSSFNVIPVPPLKFHSLLWEALTEVTFKEFAANYALDCLHFLDELRMRPLTNEFRKLVIPLDISSYYQHHLTEYLLRGSLENQLFKRHSTPLPLKTRLKIALEVAEGPKKPVIYRDFKPSNILLDSDYNAKLSDFGLAKDGLEGDGTHVSLGVTYRDIKYNHIIFDSDGNPRLVDLCSTKDGLRGEDTHVSTRVMGIVKLAKGLAFLHGAKKPVIYRDIKLSNILLDSNYNAKLSDFGWAKDGPEGDGTHVSTGVMGIQGYTAPEYIMKGSLFSLLNSHTLCRCYGNVPRDPKFQHDYTYEHSQHIRRDIVQCLSSLVVSIVVSLGIFYNIWNSQLSIFQVQPLHKEHNYRLSIWPSLLGLFGFMVFVCAVAVMNLVGAPFTSMQKAMLIFLAILMHLQSANSIIEVFVTLVGGLSMGWYSFGSHQMK